MKKLFLFPIRVADGLVDRILAVIGVVSLAQFPQFFTQYLQRLGGHVEEARLTIARYIQAAESLDLTLEEYVAQHLAAENEVFVSSGQVLNGIIQRLDRLEDSLLALKQAGPFSRWWVFLLEMDRQIVRQTWQNFTPGIPTTLEGLIYGLTGLLLAWGLYQGLKSLIRILWRAAASLLRSTPVKPGIPG